jgi:hypothetical protein
MVPQFPSRARRRFCQSAAALAMLPMLASCDRLKSALKEPAVGDPVWQADSSLIAKAPPMLFRVLRKPDGDRVVPIATIGEKGFQPLYLSNRGWRALDLNALHSGVTLQALRGSDVSGTVKITRGMWEGGTALDSIEGCRVIVPGARAQVPDGVELLVSGARPARPAGSSSADGAIGQTLETIATLVAPTLGIPLSAMPRYRRQVHVVPTGATAQPTLVVIYDDPEVVPDSVPVFPQPRPRQLIVVLDKGIYGYKPSHTFSTLGNRKSPPRRRFLGAVDVDEDGKAELLFGLQDPRAELITIGFRFRVEAWDQSFTYERLRCHG